MAAAHDWPQWGGTDQRNMVSDEKRLPDRFEPGEKRSDGSGIDLATTRNVRWTAKLGSQTCGSPTVAAGRVYVGTNDCFLGDPKYRSTRGGLVKCIDEHSGRLVWQLVIPRLEHREPEFNFDDLDLGVCSSPTVEGNRLYLVGNRCDVLCLDVGGMANGNDGPFRDERHYCVGPTHPPVEPGARDGDIVWRYDMRENLRVWPQDCANCSVLIHGDLVYVCTSNGVDRSHDRVPSPLAPSLIVLDKHTGRLVAKDEEQIGTRLFHGQWSSPSLGRVGDKWLVLFGGGEGVCYAFEALAEVPETVVPLKKVWSFDCNPPHYKFRNGKRIPYRDGDIRLHRPVNKGDGSFFGPSEIIATPVLYKDRVYVATGQDPSHGPAHGMLTCIDATQAGDVTRTAKVWAFDQIGRSLSTVAIAGGLLYIADIPGNLYCLDPETGGLYWKYATKAETWASPLVADGKVYLGTKKSFWVFAAGKTCKVLSQIQLGAPCWCTPAAANGTLYVASNKYLWAVEKPANHRMAALGNRPLGAQGGTP
jgi:outer membrane protein assembly factor BamB